MHLGRWQKCKIYDKNQVHMGLYQEGGRWEYVDSVGASMVMKGVIAKKLPRCWRHSARKNGL